MISILTIILVLKNLSNQLIRLFIIIIHNDTSIYKSVVLCFMNKFYCDININNLIKNEICRTFICPYNARMEETIHQLRGKYLYSFYYFTRFYIRDYIGFIYGVFKINC